MDDVSLEQLPEIMQQPGNMWVDVVGLGDEKTMLALGELLTLHPLMLEDIVNAPQRPKIDRHDRHSLVVTRMLQVRDDVIMREQVSIVLGNGFVLTVQERPGDVFDPVRQRLERPDSRLRNMGSDYLAYALWDSVVDGYYPVIDAVSEWLEALELEVIADPGRDAVARIYRLKRDLLMLRRAFVPTRDAISSAMRDADSGFSPDVRTFLRDTFDHCMQMTDVLETYREMTGGLLDVYLSTESNRMNEIMKVLTIMASIFIPLTFLAGIYGMNFEAMPELKLPWAYPALLIVMAALGGGLTFWFWRKGWLSRRR